MSHETTATRKYVDGNIEPLAAQVTAHIEDVVAHVTQEDRDRWDAGVKGDKGDDGADGEDGTSVTLASYRQDATPGGKSSFTLTDGTTETTIDVYNGLDGKDGADGDDGASLTVESFQQSTEPGGVSLLRLSDGTAIEIHNGRNGADGADGEDGEDGADGEAGVISFQSLTESDFNMLLASIIDILASDSTYRGEPGAVGARGSYWHASDTAMFTGNDTTPGNFTNAGTYVDEALPGDMLLVTTSSKIYECIAAMGDTYDGVEQVSSLWAYRMTVTGPKGDKGDKGDDGDDGNDGAPGPMSTFVPMGSLTSVVNQSSIWLETSGALTFPCPTVAEGQLLEYVLYVSATGGNVTVSAASSFSALTNAGYTVYSNNDNLLDTIVSGSIAAFTVSKMGTSNNVLIMRALLDSDSVAAP